MNRQYRWAWIAAVSVASVGFAAMASAAADPKVIRHIEIDGSINPASSDFIRESIEIAEENGEAALVIQLDTPGGLLDSAKSIVKEMLSAPVPVIVYVAPGGSGAISAGVFVTMAAHIAAMAPGTNIGAAHPVGGQGEDIGGDMRMKVENFTASLSKSIASERGRNVEWAERAVRESVSVSEREALENKVIDIVAVDFDDLLRQADGRTVKVKGGEVKLDLAGATITRGEMRLSQIILNIVADPNIAYLLMAAATLGFYVEFSSPGLIFPGVAGAISLLLGLAALQVLPINYSGLGLAGLGIALLIAELFLPSFGVLGVGGLISFVLGSLLLFDTSHSDLVLNPAIVYAAAGTLGLYSLLIGALVVRSQRQPSRLGREGLIGQAGEVREAIAPSHPGKVMVAGELWNAASDAAIGPGTRVRVVSVDGMQVRVQSLS